MNRRGLLKLLTGSAVGIIAGEELAELLAPRKTIILAPRGGRPAKPDGYFMDEAWIKGAAADTYKVGDLLSITHGWNNVAQVYEVRVVSHAQSSVGAGVLVTRRPT